MKAPSQGRQRRIRGLTLLVAALTLLASLPARFLVSLFPNTWEDRVMLSETSGRWWSGNGRLYLRANRESEWHALGNLHWRLLPDIKHWLTIGLGGGQMRLNLALNLVGQGFVVPAETLLQPAASVLPSQRWQGCIVIEYFQLAPLAGSAVGKVAWLGAGSALLPTDPLGDYSADWRWHPVQGLSADIRGGKSGTIELSGQFGLTPSGKPSPNLRLKLNGSLRQQLDSSLRVFTEPGVEAGEYRWIQASAGTSLTFR